MTTISIEDALKWADVFGKIQCDPPNGNAPALTVLAAEVRKLRKHEYICNRCGIRKDSETDKPEF